MPVCVCQETAYDMKRPAIFLDRDGVVNQNRDDYVKSWGEFCFLPGTLPALRQLARLQLPVIIVTNQAGIARQMTTRQAIDEIHTNMLAAITHSGGRVDDIYLCPHQAADGCDCRKPRPGMLLEAARRHNIDLSRSVLIGDAETDLLAGERAGCRTILVLSGRGSDSLQAINTNPACSAPTAVAADLTAAVPVIRHLVAQREPIRRIASFPSIDIPIPMHAVVAGAEK
jgi:D-glycero-D-manno-heptose 1,7-bisphosphate phosphatase